MRGKLFACGVAVLVCGTAVAQTPVAELVTPPAEARHFVIQSTAGKHGDSWSWVAADGTRMGRESLNLRGQVWETDFSGNTGPDGMPSRVMIRGVTPQGDASEQFSIKGGTASWKSPVDGASASYATPAFYSTFGGPIEGMAWFIERLLASPGRSLALLPGGRAKAEKLTTVEIGEGSTRQMVTGWAITGLSNSPVPVWADSNNRFFGVVVWLAWLPEAYAGDQARLETAQTAALAARSPELARSLARTPAGPVAFVSVRMFDAENKRFLANQTVVVDKGLIVQAGSARSVKVPPGTNIIDGKDRTLVPGLWDSHMHVSDDTTGLQELSLGITSIRDPGNNDQLTIDRRERIAKGDLLFPNVYPSSLIDGKGQFTAQAANVATSEAEAVAHVAKAKEKGFTGVKFYGTLNPAWLSAAIREAKRLGLHVHGHIPAGIRPVDAINAGYDEITHINWIMMQAMPDSVIGVSNSIMRFEGPGRYAKDVDLEGSEISGMIKTMAQRRIVSDPTMVTFEALYVPENGDLSPAYAAFAGTLPPATERSFRAGGFAVPKDLTRADYRASWAKMVALLGQMHRAGVPIVAGTDGVGLELVRELEIYVEAGMTPAEALATATLAPAQLVGQDKRTGSIRIGKVADLVLVEGDPSRRINDLRQTRIIMLGGKLLEADALRNSAGFSGRPK
jgi:imidazolonepropionase-like amidohydrolase